MGGGRWQKSQNLRDGFGRKTFLASPGFEGGRDHDLRNVGDLLKLEKTRHGFSPRATRMEPSPADTLIFSSMRSISDI